MGNSNLDEAIRRALVADQSVMLMDGWMERL